MPFLTPPEKLNSCHPERSLIGCSATDQRSRRTPIPANKSAVQTLLRPFRAAPGLHLLPRACALGSTLAPLRAGPDLLCRPLYALQIHAFFRHFVQRRKLAQAFHGFDDPVGDVIHFGFGVEAADAETN